MRNTNYERVSIYVKNKRTLDLVYTFKMYIEKILDHCEVLEFYLECDGQQIFNYENIEDYKMVNFIIEYIPVSDEYGFKFYNQHCIFYSKEELRIFIITNDGKPQFYTYNGKQVSYLSFSSNLKISTIYQTFEANPMSIMFEIPQIKEQDEFKYLMKQWVEVGSVFYEECVDEEVYDGYVSYLVEPIYYINRVQLTKMIELYNELISQIKKLEGRIISVQPLLLSKNKDADLVIKVEKNSFGTWKSEPFFKPMIH